jgi:Predicted membrane protein (DUF2207).
MVLFRKLAPALLALALVLLPRPSGAEESIPFFSSSASVRGGRFPRSTGRHHRPRGRSAYPERHFPGLSHHLHGQFRQKPSGSDFPLKKPFSTENGFPTAPNPAPTASGFTSETPKGNAPLGEQTYTLVYVTTGQLGFFDEHDELYWNVTGNDWVFPILKARFSASLPGNVPFSSVDIYTGPQGAPWTGCPHPPRQLSGDHQASCPPVKALPWPYTWPKGHRGKAEAAHPVRPVRPLRERLFLERSPAVAPVLRPRLDPLGKGPPEKTGDPHLQPHCRQRAGLSPLRQADGHG